MMRYMQIEWLGTKPSDKEVFLYLSNILGKLGVVDARIRVAETISCENAWVNHVRGALALKWQFRVKKISGTKKGLRG